MRIYKVHYEAVGDINLDFEVQSPSLAAAMVRAALLLNDTDKEDSISLTLKRDEQHDD